MRRDKTESLSQWRDRLWLNFRTPVVTTALDDIKVAYVEIVNPLLYKNVVEAIEILPDGLRNGKSLFTEIVNEMFSEISYASVASIEDADEILKRKDILKNLYDLDGIGDTQVKSIEDFFSNEKNSNIIQSLIAVLNIDDFKKISKKGKFSNKNIMFTGGFEKMSRSEAKALAEENGAKILGSVSKKLDYLVIGNSKPTKKKIEKAKELKIDLMTEERWYDLLNR